MDKVNLDEKLALVRDYWSPKIVADLNDSYIKVVKMKGEFVWHHHTAEDEMFYVVKGVLRIDFRDRQVPLGPGELLVVPRGVEHRPVAIEEVRALLIEPKTTVNTGEVRNKRTHLDLDRV
ncbi:MAG TPA: cupin domain-containing protein [Thermoplasmata archaeon]